jgi:hypothetical protein
MPSHDRAKMQRACHAGAAPSDRHRPQGKPQRSAVRGAFAGSQAARKQASANFLAAENWLLAHKCQDESGPPTGVCGWVPAPGLLRDSGPGYYLAPARSVRSERVPAIKARRPPSR